MHTGSTYRRVFLSIVLCLGTIAISAQGKKKDELPESRILFVFDASQSMWGRWESGTKIDIAQKLIGRMLDSLDRVENRKFQLALRVYGHQSPVPPQDCKDTQLEVPFREDNVQRIKQRLKKLYPKGTTPIAYSLERTASDFTNCSDCRNVVILITDGIEACDGDPCAVSLKLQKKGIVLKPFVIGIGMDDNFRETFECVGQYYDAANEKTFENVLGVVISQALDNTTAQVNLMDENGQPSETDVPFVLSNHLNGKRVYQYVHTMNPSGNPDTLVLDPLMTYDMEVFTIPPKRLDSIKLVPGKHNHIGLSTPRGSLELRVGGRKGSPDISCIVRQKGEHRTLNVQQFGKTQKYITGEYDIEILTLPRYYRSVSIEQSKTTTVEIPPPGRVQITPPTGGYGSILQETKDGLEWVIDLEPDNKRQTLYLQPGNYTIIFRPKHSHQTIYSIKEKFRVSGGSTSIVNFN